ncbi:hypothetical protein CC77DRAFT_1084010 [Alternaria alternata]|uniref:C2H2-type domain-containing protein n=1 Tax=Alternaria alternata TaxID=5599 RepID=A0A177DVH1_ALTAL|nr:hypothetical protein CC77DRAFT_1084010 [Alternaria alternata]OAG23617.1 hypothetical protein CC77DRAFT_1084010 [Alternaria alternata]
MDAAEDIMDANSDSDSPAKDLRVKCTVRSKSYATKKTMQDHRSTKHRANKPIHTCSVCGRICKDKHGLMRHEKTHNRAPEPKVKCSVCERTFSLVGALKNHKRTHHTDITLTVDCPVCKKIFPGEGDVLQHRQKAHVPNFALMADPLYEYVDCHFTFLSRDRMNNHLLFRSLSPASISPAQLAVHLGKKRKRSSNPRPSPTRHAKCQLMTASTALTTALTTMRTNGCSSYTSNRSKYSIKSLAFFPLYRHRPQQLRCSWNPS